MGYRDESTKLRIEIDELQGELDRAHARIRELEQTDAKAKTLGQRLAGAPMTLRVERELPVALDEDLEEEIVAVLRRRFGSLGQTTRIGRTLAWSTLGASGTRRFIEVQLTTRGGRTRVELVERLGNLAGGFFGGIVGGVGGGGFGLWVPLFIRIPAMIPVGAVLWVLLVYVVTRQLFAGMARRREQHLVGVAHALEGLAEARAEKSRRGRAGLRVADDESDADAELEAEADAESDVARERHTSKPR